MSPCNSNSESPLPSFADADLLAALRRSGYLLEQRVERVVVDAGYEVYANRRVPDVETGKPREMDFLAEMREPQTVEQSAERPAVGAALLIECLNNRFPLAFFEKPATFTESFGLSALHGVPLHVRDTPESCGFSRLEDDAGVSWRRTLSRLSTQYCTFEPKQSKPPSLNATQSSDHHGTFEKLIAESERYADFVMNPGLIQAGSMGGWLTLIRPVVVLQGRLIAVLEAEGNISIEERGHIHYLRRGVFGERRVAWVVDVITEASLPSYLSKIATTLNQVRSYCIENRARVQESFKSDSVRRLALMTPRSTR